MGPRSVKVCFPNSNNVHPAVFFYKKSAFEKSRDESVDDKGDPQRESLAVLRLSPCSLRKSSYREDSTSCLSFVLHRILRFRCKIRIRFATHRLKDRPYSCFFDFSNALSTKTESAILGIRDGIFRVIVYNKPN